MQAKDCCKCHQAPRLSNRSYCKDCWREYIRLYMRKWVKAHERNPEQRKKESTRRYTRILVAKGKISREGCRVCGEKAEAHHPDYGDSYTVEWLCFKHHRQHHRELQHLTRVIPTNPPKSTYAS